MKTFFYGVIEGFYGRQWSWQDRKELAPFLRCHGYDCYIYAPKGDEFLRQNWRSSHSPQSLSRLRSLGEAFRRQGLRWGVGLSPLGLARNYSTSDRKALKAKIIQLNSLKPDILGILFDDSRGDIAGLADRQLSIVEDILSVSSASQHIVCPTYYSTDPVLEQVFGPMPDDYLQLLGRELPKSIGLFWTGSRVISPSYHDEELTLAGQLLGRKPVLWDNYPVNDGRLTSNFLHLRPFTGRPHQLKHRCEGHLVNPMNQIALSRLVLPSLQAVYAQDEQYNCDVEFKVALDSLDNQQLAKSLANDVELFQERGLMAIDDQQMSELLLRYRSFSHPVASEIVEWLSGKYQFDPACLTE